MSEDLLKIVESLIESRTGYSGRLAYIRDALLNGRKIYDSDKKYVEDLIGRGLGSGDEGQKSEQTREHQKLKKTELLASLPLAVLILFAITRYLSFFQVEIYPIIDRATATTFFSDTVTGSLLADDAVITFCGLATMYLIVKSKARMPIIGVFAALGGFLVLKDKTGLDMFALLVAIPVITIFIAGRLSSKKITRHLDWRYLLYAGIAVIFCFEMFVVSVWAAYPFVPNYIKKSFLWHPVLLESELFYALARLSPYLLILTIYSFLARPAHNLIRNRLEKPRTMEENPKMSKISAQIAKNEKERAGGISDRLYQKSYLNYLYDTLSLEKMRRDPGFAPNILFDAKILLGIAIMLSVAFAVYPYLPTINPHYKWISVDDFFYEQSLAQLEAHPAISTLVHQIFVISGGDRPATMLILEGVRYTSGLAITTVVRFFPVILGPALVLSVYYFVQQGIKNSFYASYAALLTATSYQIVVGLYAGFIANWMGIVAAFVFFALLYRFWEKPSAKNYLLIFGHSLLSFSLYVYIDVYLLLTMLVFLGISAAKFAKDLAQIKKVVILASIFAIYAAIFESRMLLGSSALYSSLFAREDISFTITEFQNRWLNFPYFMHLYVGGFFANTLPLVFAFVWTLWARYEKTFDRIMLSAIFVGSVPIIFGNPVLQSRVFYDMPIFVAAALGILKILNRRSFDSSFAKIAFVLVTASLFVCAIRSLSNFVIGGA